MYKTILFVIFTLLDVCLISLFVIFGLVLVFFHWFKLRKKMKRAKALYLIKTTPKRSEKGSPKVKDGKVSPKIKEKIIVHKPTSPPLFTVGPRSPLSSNITKNSDTKPVAPLITSLMQIKLSQTYAEDSTTSEDDLKKRYGFKINDSSKTRLKKIFTKDPRPRKRPKEVIRKLSGPTIMGMRPTDSEDNVVVTLSNHTKLSQYASEPVNVRAAPSIPKVASSSSEERKNMDKTGLANPTMPPVRYPSVLLGMEDTVQETSLIKGFKSTKSSTIARFMKRRKKQETQFTGSLLNEIDFEVLPDPFKIVPGISRNRVSPLENPNSEIRPNIREAAKLQTKTKPKKKLAWNKSVESVFAWEKSPELYNLPNKD